MSTANEKQSLAVMVVDDEPLARQRLASMLDGMSNIQLVAEAADGEQCLKMCSASMPDVVLLDIEMPGRSGMEVANALNAMDSPPAIIFCTAYDEFALDAFNRSAFDYLLKPVNAERLQKAIAKVSAFKLGTAAAGAIEKALADAMEERYIWVNLGRGRQRLAVDRIRLLRAESKYVVAVTDAEELLLEGSLRSWEEEYPGEWLRIHRSTLVSHRYFSGWRRMSDGRCVALVDGLDIQPVISRRHTVEVQKNFKDE